MKNEVTRADEPLTIAPGADSSMISYEAEHVPQATCTPDLELQTADTQQLEPIEVESTRSVVEHTTSAQEDTLEIEPVTDSRASDAETVEIPSIGVPGMNEQASPQIVAPSA